MIPEFKKPENANYDNDEGIVIQTIPSRQPYDEQLLELIGYINHPDQLVPYGITMNEYNNPNAETISKVQAKIDEMNKGHTLGV